MGDVKIVNVADIKDPSDKGGRTYREINNARKHVLSVGDLVEHNSGVRLFVAKQTRDCDGTPLYSLTPIKGDYIQHTEGFGNPTWLNGYSEDFLTLIKPTK